MIIANKERLQLPTHRNVEKDTHEYIALMNSKIEFLKLARLCTSSPYLGWIDAGSSKMISDPDSSYAKLAELQLKGGLGVLIPGCYQRPAEIKWLMNNVWWSYLGTFFVCESCTVEQFYRYSVQSLVKFFIKGIVVWEVNIWVDISQDHPSLFTWYAADHNDSFTNIPIEYHNTSGQ